MTTRTFIKRLPLATALLLCATLALAQPRPAQTRPAQDDPAPEAAARATQTDQVRVLLVANLETTLSSPVAARIVTLHARLGLPFDAGQTLVAFDCDEPRARLKMAQADVAGAQETLDARLRMQGLEQASAVEVALASAAVNKARGQVELSEAQVAQCTVQAPWSGRAAKLHVKNHMSVTPGQPLLDLVKSGPLRLRFNLPSRLVARVGKGAALDVAIDETGKTYEVRVRAVNSRVDPISQTVEVEAMLARPYPELLPGMSGVANLASLR